ncbi:MAG: polyprenyl synthetase family protein [Bacteroidota bacterium]|nr:polyprenyl synthetase family protein [Candidatus Kapabacteria bacterium]MDW8220443.1 polyprenyl synthetase family protein [Bacteroidota bacterium]
MNHTVTPSTNTLYNSHTLLDRLPNLVRPISPLQHSSSPYDTCPSPQHLSAEFQQRCSEYRAAVEVTLRSALQHAEPTNLAEQMRYVLSNGGKRLRPLLTMMSCGAVGGNPYYATMGGVVIEILHNFTLVHDDIMDEAPLRRGVPTVHTRWNTSIAILSGDAMMAFAYKLLLKQYSLHPRFLECADLITRAILEVCEGQVIDMEFEQRAEVSMQEYIGMIEKKTARMLELCTALGTVLGNGSARELAALRTFARSIGIAFQILDDILDATATTPEFGKALGGDIAEGKKTFLIVYALQHRHTLSIQDAMLLDEFLQNKGLPRDRVHEMIDVFERNRIFCAAHRAVELYTQHAQAALEDLPAGEYRRLLQQFAIMLLERCF